MAADLWPYSQRQGGLVNDLEHEALWLAVDDGILPGQPSTAFAVSTSAGTWTVQPGRLLIAGHVLSLDAQVPGSIPVPTSGTQQSVVVAYLDRTTAPWTYGVALRTGTAGAGRPTLPKSPTDRYEVALRAFTVDSTGAVTLLADERPFINRIGGPTLRAIGADPSAVPLTVQGASGQTADLASIRDSASNAAVSVSAGRRVGIGVPAPGSSTLHVSAVATTDTTQRLTRRASQTGDLLQIVTEAGTSLVNVDNIGNLTVAGNIVSSDTTDWATYIPNWGNAGSPTFAVRTGRWRRIGRKTVAFQIYVKIGTTAGSGTLPVWAGLPTNPARIVRQVFVGHTEGPGYTLSAVTWPDGTVAANAIDRILYVNASVTANLLGSDCAAGMQFSIAGVYEEL
ncbi:hypothetical protein [Actinopolymorpha pittospori]|uniref:Uncharacterized protein n=1 Tax=Actinopolymorpha pittospori TaxID=648752 RepID=A0A927RBN1_9ACTN|nr:hypothetical protein [Actinopolymorpha pittospori]MBE1606240.1 hypothetical protein [Actinopolymorpha pittospori]